MTSTPIVALDYSSADAALQLTDRLVGSCDFYKVGSELFTRTGPAIVDALRQRGARVFLDLKFHDIPNTVRSAARAAQAAGAHLITVHASGGADMIAAAVEGAGTGCRVLAVTVLTSFDDATLGQAWGRESAVVSEEVDRLATLAQAAGAFGVVCSGHELEAVRRVTAGTLATLVPGIRFAESESHDQKRVMTPRMAARAGADFIVVGRAVTGASDPVVAMRRVREEVGSAAA